MVAAGYISIILLVIGLIVLSEKILSPYISEEYCRKILHIGVFAVLPLANHFLGSGSVHFIIICAVFSAATLILFYGKKFKTIDKREQSYPGIFYYALSLLILSVICYFNNSLCFFFGVAFISLAIGDGFATLIGYTFKGAKIYKNKTFIGFFACFFATFTALLIYNALCGSLLSLAHIIVLSLFVSIVELVDFGLDNIVLPIFSFFLSAFILTSEAALVSLAIFETVFLIAFILKVIDYYGSLAASGIAFLFYYFAGLNAILFIVGCYALMLTVSVIGKILKNDLSSVVLKTGMKDFTEIFVNGIWAVIGIILFAATKNHTFFVIALLSMSEGFVDSLASDVGTLSKKTPYDLIRKSHVQKGVSGGVTVLGSTASFLGAILFSTVICLICKLPLYLLPLLTVILYTGCIADTVFGSLFQVKYRCSVCGLVTEKEKHCEKDTEVISGKRFVNNDTVNCLSGMVVFLLSFTLLAIL